MFKLFNHVLPFIKSGVWISLYPSENTTSKRINQKYSLKKPAGYYYYLFFYYVYVISFWHAKTNFDRPVAELKEFESRLKSAKTRFKLSAGLNLQTFDTI